MARLITNPAANWLYSSEPEANTNGRRLPVPRGKLLGGSNSMMDGIPDRMRGPRVVGSPCTVIDAQIDRLIARFVVKHADSGPVVRIRLPAAESQDELRSTPKTWTGQQRRFAGSGQYRGPIIAPIDQQAEEDPFKKDVVNLGCVRMVIAGPEMNLGA
jgi:hypothetical protein